MGKSGAKVEPKRAGPSPAGASVRDADPFGCRRRGRAAISSGGKGFSGRRLAAPANGSGGSGLSDIADEPEGDPLADRRLAVDVADEVGRGGRLDPAMVPERDLDRHRAGRRGVLDDDPGVQVGRERRPAAARQGAGNSISSAGTRVRAWRPTNP